MIRKQTWVLLIIFLVLLGAAYYLQKNPLPTQAELTPSPTSQALMISNWNSGDIVSILYVDSEGTSTTLGQDSQGKWVLQPGGDEVDLGKIEEIRSQILATRIIASLDPGYDLNALGLQSPKNTLSIKNSQGNQVVIRIGNITPTQTGYYIQVDNNTPSVVSNTAIDSLIGLLKRDALLNITPTPINNQDLLATPTP